MASASSQCLHFCIITCCGDRGGAHREKSRLNCVKINGTKSVSSNVDRVSVLTTTSIDRSENLHVLEQHDRQNIPTMKQMVDPFRQGIIVDEGIGYRQTIVTRSYEVGPDKTATIETVLNLLQETALNHVWMSGLLSDGFGATHGMMKNNLIWVVSRMQVQVDHYPIWGEVMEIDTWVGASGKNGMRRDWLIKSQATGHIFARATSTWVMMNQETRRLSKMPDEVRAEISPWFIDKYAIVEESHEKIEKLDNNARYVLSDLKPKRTDLDMNQHVNNVKYVRWMLEAIPDEFLENHQLSGITLEYRRECGRLDVVQSLCEPHQDDDWLSVGFHHQQLGFNGHSSDFIEENGFFKSLTRGPLNYTHLLQAKGESKNEEIVRGKTTWKRKKPCMPFPP